MNRIDMKEWVDLHGDERVGFEPEEPDVEIEDEDIDQEDVEGPEPGE